MDQILHKLTRREMLKTATCGFGGLALTGMNFGKDASPNSLVPKTALFSSACQKSNFYFYGRRPEPCGYF